MLQHMLCRPGFDLRQVSKKECEERSRSLALHFKVCEEHNVMTAVLTVSPFKFVMPIYCPFTCFESIVAAIKCPESEAQLSNRYDSGIDMWHVNLMAGALYQSSDCCIDCMKVDPRLASFPYMDMSLLPFKTGLHVSHVIPLHALLPWLCISQNLQDGDIVQAPGYSSAVLGLGLKMSPLTLINVEGEESQQEGTTSYYNLPQAQVRSLPYHPYWYKPGSSMMSFYSMP